MEKKLAIGDQSLSLNEIKEFIFRRADYKQIEITADCQKKIEKSHQQFLALLEQRLPIYGVTTGFGDNCTHSVDNEKAELLQNNLISYLLCGTGGMLSADVGRAVSLCRLNSLCRGFSGVSMDLIERMRLYLANDWVPVIPKEGSLGASGDLVPLAYLAQILRGEGNMYCRGQIREASEVLKEAGVTPYRFKPKEGLALVNGTSTMAGLSLLNLTESQFLFELSCLTSSWLCLALKGRTEAFGPLVNERAKAFPGQALAAKKIRGFLEDESYTVKPLQSIQITESRIQEQVQDRYSLRCAPQILGPVQETFAQFSQWLELEINGVSDNPLIDEEGQLQMGGNFYGGYLSHGMDYIKISLGQIADMMDRQLMTLMDAKTNRGLPPNLVAWNKLPREDHFLHHGLKGLHQSVSAITSEIMARATPNSIFSRSAETHNQDKVSLGMSAAVQCMQVVEPLYTITAMYLICLAQGLDIRGVKLHGKISTKLYQLVRKHVPFVEKDRALDQSIVALANDLKKLAKEEPTFLAREA